MLIAFKRQRVVRANRSIAIHLFLWVHERVQTKRVIRGIQVDAFGKIGIAIEFINRAFRCFLFPDETISCVIFWPIIQHGKFQRVVEKPWSFKSLKKTSFLFRLQANSLLSSFQADGVHQRCRIYRSCGLRIAYS